MLNEKGKYDDRFHGRFFITHQGRDNSTLNRYLGEQKWFVAILWTSNSRTSKLTQYTFVRWHWPRRNVFFFVTLVALYVIVRTFLSLTPGFRITPASEMFSTRELLPVQIWAPHNAVIEKKIDRCTDLKDHGVEGRVALGLSSRNIKKTTIDDTSL